MDSAAGNVTPRRGPGLRAARCVALLFGCFMLTSAVLRAGEGSDDVASRIARGQAFLVGLFDPELDLLPEFRGSSTYWLFHDNYLAAHLLADVKPEWSRRIRSALTRFGVTNSGKIEIVFNEAPNPLPFRTYQLTDVTTRSGKRIRTEWVTTNLLTGWEEYADLLLLASMAQAESAPDHARRDFRRAAALWDGHGFKDRVVQKRGIYATYKLALYLIAAERLKLKTPQADDVRRQLLAMQSAGGGWRTDYNLDGPIGLANVETTCLALLALRSPADPKRR
jgi:hypothetical protein